MIPLAISCFGFESLPNAAFQAKKSGERGDHNATTNLRIYAIAEGAREQKKEDHSKCSWAEGGGVIHTEGLCATV